jgi:hypothetical protein
MCHTLSTPVEISPLDKQKKRATWRFWNRVARGGEVRFELSHRACVFHANLTAKIGEREKERERKRSRLDPGWIGPSNGFEFDSKLISSFN